MKFHFPILRPVSSVLRPLSFILMIGSWLLFPMSCQRTKPQAPANRSRQVDSTELAMALLTQQMVEGANTELARYVNTLDTAYTLDSRGYWYTKTRRTDGDTIRKEQEALLRVVVHDLQGTLLTDSEVAIVVGKQALPAAIDAFLQQMCMGEKASLIVPWYAAYGATGTETIPAYENIRMEIEVIE